MDATVWLEAISALGMPLAVIGGPLLAWRIYGRHLGWRELVAAVVGAVLGGAVFHPSESAAQNQPWECGEAARGYVKTVRRSAGGP